MKCDQKRQLIVPAGQELSTGNRQYHPPLNSEQTSERVG